MPEIGICCAKCKIKSKCFFVKPYFLCYHTQCYNTTNKFLCCIVCGEPRFRNYFKRSNDEVILNNTILNDNSKCQCYNTTNKFLCCIVCGERRFRSYFKFNGEDTILNNTILNDNKCLCCNKENIQFILCKT